MIRRYQYPLAFALVVIALIMGTLTAYGRISQAFLARAAPPMARSGNSDSPLPTFRFAPASEADFDRFARDDSLWREKNAKTFTLAELRARGDGRRTPRQLMQDRVFEYTRRGERGRAITEMERWVASNPGDEATLLSLARLLAEAGRTDASVSRYRQLIALQERGRR